ncbi:MAG: zf-HC2 domain-containing protein [Myxococcota bacterium]
MNERTDGGISCSEVLDGLSDYLEGDLPPAVVARVEVHLAHCTNCQRFGADFGALVTSLRRLPVPEPSAEALETLRQALDKG